MVLAELTLTHPDLPLSACSRAVPGEVVRSELQPGGPADPRWLFASVETATDTDLEAALAADHTVTAPLHVGELEGSQVYRAGLTDEVTLVRPALTRLGIRVLGVHSRDSGWYHRLLLPDRDVLGQFRTVCEETGIEFQVETLTQESTNGSATPALTGAQRAALALAYREGYFNDPRDVTLQELAAQMQISPSALGRRMRRGMDSLVASTLE